MAFYSKKLGFGMAPRRCEIRSKTKLQCRKNLFFIVARTLACACMPVYVYACMKHKHAELEHKCAYVYMCTHVLRFSWPLFSKNSLFGSKRVIFFQKHFP